jgi:hypothetical protein
MVRPWEFSGWLDRTRDLVADLDDAQIEARMTANADLMEAILVLAFHRAARNLGSQAPGEDTKINPYAVGLDPARWEADGLFDGTGLTVKEARQTEASGLELMYVERIAEASLSS